MKDQEISQHIRIMQVIHWTVTAFPFLFGAVVFIINESGYTPQSPELTDTFLYVAAGLLLLAVPLSEFIFKSYLKQYNAGKERTPGEMIAAYKTAHLIRISIFEIVGFFAAYAAYLTGYIQMLGITVIVFIVMASLVPSRTKMAAAFGMRADDLL